MVRNLQYMQMRTIGKKLPRNTDTRGKQVLNRCSTREEEDDFVLIDVDSDIPDIIIIDVPESVQKKLRKPSPRTVINIDDDDDDEVEDEVGNNGNDSASASSSRSSGKATHSKYKQTSSRNGASRNRYGLDLESESGSSESDCSDCECMEGPSGKLRYQWELASKRRKTGGLHTGVSSNNQASTSAPIPDHNFVPREENAASQQHTSKQCSPTHMRNGEENYEGNTFGFPDDFEIPGVGPSSRNVPDAMTTGTSSMGNNSTKYGEKPHFVDVDPHFTSFSENEHGAQEPAMATNEWGASFSYTFENVETRIIDEPCLDTRQSSFNEQFDFEIAEPLNGDPSVVEPLHSDNSDHECDRVASMDVNEELPNGEENSAADLTSFRNFTSNNKVDVAEKNATDCRETGVGTLKSNQKPETDIGACLPVQMEIDESTSDRLNEVTINKTTDVLQDDIIMDRQKIKETDVYKRAMEEEMAARQRQLQIQAEEAQRLRRRKKAESMRIMDMERRQKQRLEEMREAQKKDEENLNMKERLRVEIRKELHQVEVTCRDMASLLRRLGIRVGNDLFPSQNEVQAAYKRALLKFHPDRASRTDIRQQVESEEKFKLISRMKEKFALAG